MTFAARPTQKDVARAIGVSDMTVSRVLTGRGTVSAGTRERVLSAVREMGYLRNRMAGSLASARSNQVGVILPSMHVGIFPEVLAGITSELEKAGYNPVVGVTDYDVDREESLVESLLSWNAAAIILNDFVHTGRTSQLLRQSGIPIVEIMEVSGDPIDYCVGFNHAAAARALVDHLLSRGYRRFGFLGWHGTRFAASARFAAMRDHLAAQGMALLAPDWYGAPPGIDDGKAGLAQIVEEVPDLDAVIFGNDLMAVGGLFCCERQGWPVPERLALAGFGGLALGQAVNRPLTTIRFPRLEVGRRAARTVLNAMVGQEGQRVSDLGFALVEGATS